MAGGWGAGALHPPPREQRRTPSTAVTPPSSSPTPPNHHRGSIITHPRHQLLRPAAPISNTTAAQGAIPRTLDANHPTHNGPKQGRPPPREQRSAPSAQLARQQHSQAEATTAQGTIPCTLNPNHPAHNDPKHMQPQPKEHHSAPSTPITPPTATASTGNRHRGSNAAHPRQQLARQQLPSTKATTGQGATPRTLDADCPPAAAPAPPNRHRGSSTVHPREQLRSPGRKSSRQFGAKSGDAT